MFISRVATLLSATALAVGLTTVAAGAAQATVTPQSTWNEITAYFDNLNNHRICIDDTNGILSNGNPMQLTRCKASATNGTFQRWHFELIGTDEDGYSEYFIYLYDNTNALGGRGLGIGDNISLSTEPANGERLELGAGYSSWSLITDPNLGSIVMLRSDDAWDKNLCMAAGNMNDTDGTPLIEKTCNPNDLSEQFSI